MTNPTTGTPTASGAAHSTATTTTNSSIINIVSSAAASSSGSHGHSEKSSQVPAEEIKAGSEVTALHKFKGRTSERELSFEFGDLIRIISIVAKVSGACQSGGLTIT